MYFDTVKNIYYLEEYFHYGHPKFKIRHLDFKKLKPYAIEFYYEQIKDFLILEEYDFYGDVNTFITVVPSHDKDNKINSCLILAKKLSSFFGFTDATECLERYKSIEKKATGGSRDLAVDINSIKVINEDKIIGRCGILLDDISTSGNSINACCKLLFDAGIVDIICITIAETKG